MSRSVLLSLAASMLFAPALWASSDRPSASQGDPLVLSERAKLTDEELARVTGKFILPNGVELALTITSDTVVNGQLLLRTVLTVDKASELRVLGRQAGAPPIAYSGSSGSAVVGSGVTVALDRNSGIQTITPNVSVTSAPAVAIGADKAGPEALGLSQLALAPGGPALATADGAVSLDTVRNGARVTFQSADLAIVNLVGQSVATAVLNSADNRTLDTVTTVAIDARNIAPYQMGAAQMRVDTLAIEATRGMIR